MRLITLLMGGLPQGTVLATGTNAVWKKVRDLGATLAVLAVLFGMLMAINPRVRERFSEMMAAGVNGRDMNSSIAPVGNAAYAAVSIGTDYASGNPFLFSFLVVAVILFMLMVRS